MNARVLSSVVALLVVALFLAAAWAYWSQDLSDDAWRVERPEVIVSRLVPGEKLHVAFVLRK